MDDVEIGEFSVARHLGSGGYGEIYAARREKDETIYAIKTESVETTQKGMDLEISVLKLLPKSPCFPEIIASGSTSAINYFVMPLYGPSLSILKNLMPSKQFSVFTSLVAAKQMLQILENLHSVGFVHCDVKPANFLLQKSSIGGLVLIDFGLSSRYRLENGKHIDSKTSDGFRGTLKYASINVHKFFEPTRRDDVISWFYSFVEMVRGSLPWSDIPDKNLSMSCKQTISPEKLCQGMPPKTIEIWKSIKDLKFDEEPNYSLIYQLIDELLAGESCPLNDPLDWEQCPSILPNATPFPDLFKNSNTQPKAIFIENEESEICCRLS